MNFHPKTFLASTYFAAQGSCLEAYTGFRYASVYLLELGEGKRSCASVLRWAVVWKTLVSQRVQLKRDASLPSTEQWEVSEIWCLSQDCKHGEKGLKIHTPTHTNPSSLPRNFHLHEFSVSWKHQWQRSHFKCLWNPLGFHLDFLNHLLTHTY